MFSKKTTIFYITMIELQFRLPKVWTYGDAYCSMLGICKMLMCQFWSKGAPHLYAKSTRSHRSQMHNFEILETPS